MRRGFIISLALHALVLFFVVGSFPSMSDRLPQKPTPVPVDLVTRAELTKIKSGERDAEDKAAKAEKKPEPEEKKQADKPRPEKVKPAKAPPPAPKEKAEPAPKKPEPEPKPEKKVAKADPAPVPAPVPQRKPRKPEPKQEAKKPEPKPNPRPAAKKPAPQKKEKDFDPDNIAALLNKIPDAGGSRTPAAAEPARKPEPSKGRSDGRDMSMTFNEIDALRAKISRCWNPPVGGLGADAIRVKLRLQLRQDGVLSQQPQLVNRGDSPFFQAAADAAVRAVMQCQPYQLPERKYALWRDMILNFDPREMFGG